MEALAPYKVSLLKHLLLKQSGGKIGLVQFFEKEMFWGRKKQNIDMKIINPLLSL